jgi:hypothetical protein
MKRLLALLLVLCGVLLLVPGRGHAARNDSDDFGVNRGVSAVRGHGRGEEQAGFMTKSSCSSDSGDTCTCGAGKLCVAGADGCACIRPAQ